MAKEIYIYTEIGPGWAGLYDARTLVSDLPKSGDVIVHINSPGGDYFEGLAIYNLLRAYKGHVSSEVDGIAASAATLPLMASDQVVIAGNATVMVHNPYALTLGDYRDKQKDAELLEGARDNLVRMYSSKTGLEYEQLNDMLDKETWMDAEEAVAWGFADLVSNPLEVAACLPLRLRTKYQHVPEDILERAQERVEPVRSAQIAKIRTALARHRQAG